MSTEQREKIKTSCRWCEFSIKDKNNNQTGCELNLINRYTDKGIESTLTEFDDVHGKGSCHEIEIFCLFRRPPKWKEIKGKGIENPDFGKIAKEELRIDVTMVVFVPPGKAFIDIVEFIQDVNQMTLKPEKVLFINYAGISPLLFRKLNDYTDVEWGMEFMLNVNKIDDINKMRKKGYDFGVRKTKTSFLITIDIDKRIRHDFIDKIRSKLIDDLESMFVLTNTIGEPNFYQTVVYNHVQGNDQIDVNDKIEWLAEDNECQHLIKKYNEIFPK